MHTSSAMVRICEHTTLEIISSFFKPVLLELMNMEILEIAYELSHTQVTKSIHADKSCMAVV